MASGRPIAKILSQKFCEKAKDPRLIDMGLHLGAFLQEFGSFKECKNVLNAVYSLIKTMNPEDYCDLLELDCLQRLIHAQTGFCCFDKALSTLNATIHLIDNTTHEIPQTLLAHIYGEICMYHFSKGEHDISYFWGMKSLKNVNKDTHPRVVIDVFRQMAKVCVVKHQFKQAKMLIQQAVYKARNTFGPQHQKYAETLLDYGFYLLNTDSIANSVAIYKAALEIFRNIFGDINIHVGTAYEDLAYGLYLQEYNSGNFKPAYDHIERAILIIQKLVPSTHLRLASAKRVKALILEEIAIDNLAIFGAQSDHVKILNESEKLHQSALQMSLEAFGEMNLQTAKNYGNLGRLYQTMSRFDEAEKMHQKAIEIKMNLFGSFDYEVGLSVGHLASLYNYHLLKYDEAEKLYLQNIDISLRLFGYSYSGLEYDYKGLIHIYQVQHDDENLEKYSNLLEEWRFLRERNRFEKGNTFDVNSEAPMEEVTQKFFEMCTEECCGNGVKEPNKMIAVAIK